MPKGKKKEKRKTTGRDVPPPAEDEYDTGDTQSVVSTHSEPSSIVGDAADGEVDEVAQQEDFEDKLKDCIDGTTQKSAKGREQCLHGLCSAMAKKYINEFLQSRKETVTDCVERCLKKGKGEEQAQAAACSSLLCVQMGAGDDGTAVFYTLRPILQTILADTSASKKARAACATALGLSCFVAGAQLEDVYSMMENLENIFKASYLKGDGVSPSHTPEVAALHCSALSAWSLLLSVCPSSQVEIVIQSHLSKLPELLTSAHVDLRIAAGEAIALLYELAREDDEEFEGDDIDDLCQTLKQLATDSNKYRAKKDRRTQRSSFRDILRTVEEGDFPNERYNYGTGVLYVDCWVRKRQYDCLCGVLASGMNTHLQENDLVREIFGLGDAIPLADMKSRKPSKVERHLYNVAAFKARTKARAKNRDKRAVVM